MSHSSGISVSNQLRDSFGKALNSKNIRLFKAQIQNEEVVEVTSKPINKSWEDDFQQVTSLLDKEAPCYILYRLDKETPHGFAWVLLCYVPDKSKVREKMLYASTRANVKKQLGMTYFTDEVFGTVPNDFTLEGYNHHITSQKSEAPLTEQELLRRDELEGEKGEIYTGGSTKYVHGVAFPVEQTVIDSLQKLKSGSINYVQIAIDCDAERVKLDHTSKVDLNGLKGQIPTNEPRFHFYAYQHEFEGAKVTSFVYLFSCPDGSKGTKSAPVRQRMLYSSSKAHVSELLTNAGASIDARLEINAPDDIVEEEIFSQIHPQVAEKEKAFSKPTRAGKGGRKLIRSPKT